MNETVGFQYLWHSNWTSGSPLNPFCSEIFAPFSFSYWRAHSYYLKGPIWRNGNFSNSKINVIRVIRMKVMLLALSIPHLVRVIRSNRSVVLHFEITRGESFEIRRQTDVKPSPLPRSLRRPPFCHTTNHWPLYHLLRGVIALSLRRLPENSTQTSKSIWDSVAHPSVIYWAGASGCVNPTSQYPLPAGGKFTQPRTLSFTEPFITNRYSDEWSNPT